VSDHLTKFQFQKGMEKTPGSGRQKGTRNKLSEAFLRDLHTEWQRSGQAVLKILAVEQPAALAALVAKTLPAAFDDEFPQTIRIITGVPRVGENYPDDSLPRAPARQSLADLTETKPPGLAGGDNRETP
jgi:hypothetical protein